MPSARGNDPARRRDLRRHRPDRFEVELRQARRNRRGAHRPSGSQRGALFVYFGKRRDAIKVFFFDGSGLCVFYKRLDKSTFRLPEVEAGAASVAIDERALDDLLDGIDVETKTPRVRAPRVH